MRKSYSQPISQNYQQGNEEINKLRERKNPLSSSSSSSSHEAEKKVTQQTKKLERLPSEEDINASADAFIKNFRQQLMLQRLQSIENYEKMLARGR
ncbi:hypothetical protein TSUD_261020 [Trifolium subterraneum]|uniref:DUF761 domain-containing protein n=1 Tax=Trifolium subterraneum TaxID=3900 RepID=A0A2Z6M9Y9_TRISU|nr:hypothetical protein TSUD_261020 [Trifolium subterraneum]